MKSLITLSVLLLLLVHISVQQPDLKCNAANYEEWKCSNDCADSCGSQICTKECHYGCFCMTGYKRNQHGVCVCDTQCPYQCPENEVVTYEYNKCTESCDGNLMNCTGQTFCRGCTCKKGYKRDGYLGICIKEEQCGPFYDNRNCETEEYICSNGCLDACPNANGVQTNLCINSCTYGWYCKPGFKRHPALSVCVPVEQCPRCYSQNNEVYLECGPNCDTTCDLAMNRTKCTIVHIRCPDGCFCKEGFARLTDGSKECIPISDCPT